MIKQIFKTNEDSMSPSNHQYVGEPSNMLQANMGQL
jgi:hypothetical protein